MKPVLIIEHCLNGLTLNEESSKIKDDKFILGGVFTEFDVRNRNERIYTSDKFLPHLNDLMERKNQLGIIYGEFDHPDVFDTSLSRVSHTVESIFHVKEHNRVDGTIRLLNTHWGKEAKALVMDNCPLFVSSRAAGVTESNGSVTLKKLFTYDCVADPGFSSARMEIKNINESLGFKNENANFRIYDLSDETKINDIFNMNKNDNVTKQQMVEYSTYLVEEINNLKTYIDENIKDGAAEPEKIQKVLEYYDSLNTQHSKVVEYLNYLADSIQISVNENKSLKETTEKLIEHNDYLAESLEKSIKYSEYLAEKLDKNIDYSEYIAETLSKNIDFSEYIAENVDKNIKYSEYLAENLDKNIDYSEYLAENLDKNIDYSEYLAESLDNSIEYAEYLAENVDSSISYSEYLAEHVDNSIAYGEYIAEHVDNSIAYSEYIAENVSDSQAYSNYLAESLDKTISIFKSSKLNESINEDTDFRVDDVNKYYDNEDEQDDLITDDSTKTDATTQPVANQIPTDQTTDQIPPAQPVDQTAQTQVQPDQTQVQPTQVQPGAQVQPGLEEKPEIIPGLLIKVKLDSGEEKAAEVMATNPENGLTVVKFSDTEEVAEVQESRITILGDKLFDSEETLKQNISKLIAESKKRKASAEQQPHFLLFLSEANKAAYIKLSPEDKEKINVAINESNGYSSEREVILIMREALEGKKKTDEEVLVENIPTDLLPVWEKLDTKVQNSIIAQSRIYGNLITSKEKIESFWNSRELEAYSNLKQDKQLITENKFYIDNNKLSEDEVNKFLNVFKKIK